MIVTRRDHETRRDHAIACLDRLADGYQFTYLAAAVAAPSFIPSSRSTSPAPTTGRTCSPISPRE